MPCRLVFGREKASAIHALIERTTGEPCPCAQGRACPLLPNVRTVPEQRAHLSPTLRLLA